MDQNGVFAKRRHTTARRSKEVNKEQSILGEAVAGFLPFQWKVTEKERKTKAMRPHVKPVGLSQIADIKAYFC